MELSRRALLCSIFAGAAGMLCTALGVMRPGASAVTAPFCKARRGAYSGPVVPLDMRSMGTQATWLG